MRRFVRADIARVHEHLVEMNGTQEEERKAGPCLNPPERRVLVTEHFSVADKAFVFVPVRRKLPHREQAMQNEHERNHRDHERDNGGIRFAEDKLPLEHFGHPPHGIVANQDRRHECHVSPHEKAEEQSTRALNEVELRGPVTFSRPLIQSNPGDDIEFGLIIHWQYSCPRAR
jgi:hypothetical protein